MSPYLLAGRSVTVLMQRPPLADFFAALDSAAALYPEAQTLKFFRANADAVAREVTALRAATDCNTPSQYVATCLKKNWCARG